MGHFERKPTGALLSTPPILLLKMFRIETVNCDSRIPKELLLIRDHLPYKQVCQSTLLCQNQDYIPIQKLGHFLKD